MATLNKTFPFLTTVEGFTAYPENTDVVMTYDSGVGNPSGSLKSRISGRNKTGTSYWEWTGTWEDLGISSGDTITQVRINDADNRCTEWNTVDACTIGPYSIYDSVGTTLIATLWAGRSPTGTEGSWTAIGNQTYQAIAAAYEASNTTIRIRLYNALDLGNNSAAALSVYDDTISLDIDYAAGSDDLTAVGVTANPVVGTPSIGQEHVLTAVGITADSVLGAPTLTRVSNLTATGITVNPVVGTPTATEESGGTDELVAVGITANPVVGTPTLGVYSVFDNFNRSNGDLDGSTASGGGTWVEFENTLWEIAANAAKVAIITGYDDQSARLDGVDFDSDDHEVEVIVTITNPPGGNFLNVGVIARKEDNATKTFYGYMFRGPAYLTRLFKFVDGTYTTIGEGTTTCEAGDILRLRCVGDQISGYLNDVLEVGPITDTDIAGATHIQGGLFLDGGNSPGDYSVDNWGGRNLPSDTDDLTAVSITANPVVGTPALAQVHVLTATGITADPVVGMPSVGRISNLTAVDITADPVVGTPTITHIHVLTATGITADPVVGTPVIGTEGEDVLTAVDITADPVLDTPSIGQEHVLDSVDITADPVVGTPSVGRISNLTAVDITADSVVGTPTIGRIPNLDAVDIVASSVLSVPTVSRVSNLIAVGITVNPVLDASSISQIHALDSVGITADPVLGTPVLGSEGEDNLEAIGITVTPVVGTPAIGQTHVLSAVGISTTPVTDTPTAGLAYILDATSIETTPVVGTPAIGQTHALSSVGITTTPVVGTPILGQICTLDAVGIFTTPVIEVPAIGQTHVLDAVTILVSPIIGVPLIGQTHILDATGITTTPDVGVPAWELVDGLVVIVFSAYQPEVDFNAYQPELDFNEYQPEISFEIAYTED